MCLLVYVKELSYRDYVVTQGPEASSKPGLALRSLFPVDLLYTMLEVLFKHVTQI